MWEPPPLRDTAGLSSFTEELFENALTPCRWSLIRLPAVRCWACGLGSSKYLQLFGNPPLLPSF